MNRAASTRPANADSSGLLKTIETSLEDIRAAVTCRICVRPLYEPYTIACGHSFCYTCLTEWFKRDPRHKTCPDCRTEVEREPAPSYLLREVTNIFVTRAELLPSDERTQDHKMAQQDEANVIEQDKARGAAGGRGLFGGQFRRAGPRRIGLIRDDGDGVSRCPRCTWEIYEGYCESCGHIVESDFSDDGLGYPEYPSDVDGSALALEEMDMYEDDSGHDELRTALRRAAGRRLPIAARPYAGPVSHTSNANTVDVDGDSATEQYDSEEDDAGSLEGFIDNDNRGPLSPTASTASDSDADELINRALGFDEYGRRSRFSPLQSDSFGGDQFYDAEQDDSDEEFDFGVAHNYRHRPQHRRVVLDDSDNSDDSDIGPNVPCGHCGHTHGNAQESNSSGGSSPFSPIEIDSDSESLPVRRARRRPAIMDDESSNDEETSTQSHHSHSSATLRDGSAPTVPRPYANHRSVNGTNRPSSAIVIASSPVRTTSAAGRSNRLRETGSPLSFDDPYEIPQPGNSNHRSQQDNSDHTDSYSDEASPRMEPLYGRPNGRRPRSRRSNRLHVPHSRSRPSRRSHTPEPSPASHAAEESVSPATLRRSAQAEERAVLKEGRRVRKQERRRRDRVQPDTASGGSH